MSTASPCSFLFSLPCLKEGGIFEENEGGIPLREIFFKGEAFASDVVDNVPENCRVGFGNRMEKKNFAVMNASGNSFKSFLVFRLVCRVPIRIGETPANGAVAHFLQKSKASFGKSAFRRTEKIHIVTEVFGDIIMQIRNLRIHFFHCNFCHIRVAGAVVSHNVAFINHSLNKFRLSFCIGKGNKENRGNAFFFEHVENLGSISVFITFVEGEVNLSLMLFAVAVKIRIPFSIFRLEPYAGYGFSGFVKICSGTPGNLFTSEI